jgi:hypothetical protein
MNASRVSVRSPFGFFLFVFAFALFLASCVKTYSVGGSVSGLSGTVTLQNNGGDDLTVSVGGTFTFPTRLVNGAAYEVTVLTQPAGQTCSVSNGTGVISGTNVTNVAVSCVGIMPPAAPTVGLGFGVKELWFTWAVVNSADFYRLSENPDGVSGYTQVATNITALGYNHTIPVHRRLNASYIVEACNTAGCTASAPLTLGTNLTQAIGRMQASNGEFNDVLGSSVALSGDGNTLAVGAIAEDSSSTGINSTPDELATDAGAVYVYTRSAGTWLQQAYLKASNTGAGDHFGYSVALSGDGDTLAVGARYEDSGSTGISSSPDELAPEAGAVYVFTRSTGAWSQQAYVKASNTGAGDLFGWSVALSGDGNTLAVGAIGEASSSTGINSTPNELAFIAGAAYIFTRSAGTWAQQAYVKHSNTRPDNLFGASVALSGDGNTLAVGAIGEASSSTGINSTPNELASSAGAVYVFSRSAGAWSQQAYVKASNTGALDQFGASVALSGDGDTLAVGARREDGSGNGVNDAPDESATDAGAVYVFSRIAGTWSQQAYVKASNTGADDFFGWSVALSGDGNTLAVGTHLEDSSTTGIGSTPDELAPSAGAVYVYTRSAGAWSQQAYVKASNTEAFENFGYSVALNGDGDTLAVGALGTPNGPARAAGAAYLY